MATTIQISASSSTLYSGVGDKQYRNNNYNNQQIYHANSYSGAASINPSFSSSSIGAVSRSTDTGPRSSAQAPLKNVPAITNYRKVDEAIERMKMNLSRFTRANDRRMVLRTLKEVKYLTRFPVTDRGSTFITFEKLEEDVCQDMFVLNGQTFYPSSKKRNGNNYANTNRYRSIKITTVLQQLCNNLCEEQPGLSPETLYKALIYKICRRLSYDDVSKTLTTAIGKDLTILPYNPNANKKQMKEGESTLPTPVQITIFPSDGMIHCYVSKELQYGLYRKSDLSKKSRPWIQMQANFEERSNVTIGDSVGHVTTVWPKMYV